MKAFVAGATGQTGRRIVSQLVERGIPVRALVRDIDRAKELLPEAAELVVGDVLDASSLEGAIADCNVLLCATGAAPGFNPFAPLQIDYLGTKNLVDVAKAKKLEHFVLVSSLCTSKLLHPLNLFFLVLVWKKQAEQYIQNSGLTYTIVRPGGLKNEDNDNSVVMSAPDTLFEGSIPRTKVAEVCIEALAASSSHNKIVEIVAPPEALDQPIPDLFARV
ncbi:SDR family oxidoreductase [Acaryochloris sp. 'Moss Beach']|uniref:SDR family oxidoreductase n=1 Tax=Acaryochloris TaxID=155977 RepID=UPI001BAFCC87|nr:MULTISPECIES: SDR family oxidoreductase [Acaryochloris]QUY43432.1 SDR family oxidoreductase [Acaryochloris marina S15]UJB68253.1 SDR family oxidoreductase [Acaryochloris sp. 'Moss Beach']